MVHGVNNAFPRRFHMLPLNQVTSTAGPLDTQRRSVGRFGIVRATVSGRIRTLRVTNGN